MNSFLKSASVTTCAETDRYNSYKLLTIGSTNAINILHLNTLHSV